MRMLAVKRSPRASLRDVPLTRRTDPEPSMTGCMVGSATRSNSCWAGAPIRRLADTEVGVDEVAADGSPAVGGAEGAVVMAHDDTWRPLRRHAAPPDASRPRCSAPGSFRDDPPEEPGEQAEHEERVLQQRRGPDDLLA